jgi:hypothetical protein
MIPKCSGAHSKLIAFLCGRSRNRMRCREYNLSEKDWIRDVQGRIVLLRRIAIGSSRHRWDFFNSEGVAGGLGHPGDEADAGGHAPHPARIQVRLSEPTDLPGARSEASSETKRTHLLLAGVHRRFGNAVRRETLLRPVRRRTATHALRFGVALARSVNSNRACPVDGLADAVRHNPRRADTLALLCPATLAQMARPQPFRGIAKFPDEPQDKAPDRKNGDLPRHKKQEDHPGRLMHDAAPCCG